MKNTHFCTLSIFLFTGQLAFASGTGLFNSAGELGEQQRPQTPEGERLQKLLVMLSTRTYNIQPAATSGEQLPSFGQIHDPIAANLEQYGRFLHGLSPQHLAFLVDNIVNSHERDQSTLKKTGKWLGGGITALVGLKLPSRLSTLINPIKLELDHRAQTVASASLDKRNQEEQEIIIDKLATDLAHAPTSLAFDTLRQNFSNRYSALAAAAKAPLLPENQRMLDEVLSTHNTGMHFGLLKYLLMEKNGAIPKTQHTLAINNPQTFLSQLTAGRIRTRLTQLANLRSKLKSEANQERGKSGITASNYDTSVDQMMEAMLFGRENLASAVSGDAASQAERKAAGARKNQALKTILDALNAGEQGGGAARH